jgi:hypothetical protein
MFDRDIEGLKEVRDLHARDKDQSNVPKNNIIVLTSPPSVANNPRRLGKQLMK